MGKMTTLEKINGCVALLVRLCMIDTNADHFKITATGLSYKGKELGDYELVIRKLAPPNLSKGD